MNRTTISVIKADIGGYVGHSACHPELIGCAKNALEAAKKKGLIKDMHVTACGDDLELIMTHTKGEDNHDIHKLAWDTFLKCTNLAKKLGLYGAGQDILSDSFSGNIKGLGPGVAEMEIEERPSEPIVIFMADKTSPGAWNYPLYKIFADPFNTAGLVIDPKLHDGFTFEVLDIYSNEIIEFKTPEELYDLLIFIGAPEHYGIRKVLRKDGEIAAVASSQKVNLIAGRYVGKDDPVLIIRTQSGFPALGEVLEPFATPHLVAGWMRGSHIGPLMPVSVRQATPSRFDGPPRVIALGFQIKDCKLVGPRDMFDDPAFDTARQMANELANYIRGLGPFEPHRLPLEQMEYTTLPQVKEKLKSRFKKLI